MPLSQISPEMQRAVVVAEDARFFEHDGVDWEAMRGALEENWEKGRVKVGELFAGFCKPRPDGLKGLKFTAESSFLVGNTLNVQWRAEADFLSEPYKGSDAYVTRGGLMAAQVTTFDGAKLKFKP